jgi:hypothetical protein
MKKLRAHCSPRLELVRLEGRTAPATIAVTNLANAGPGSLRQAILDANNESTHPGPDTILFTGEAVGETIELTNHSGTEFGLNALEVTSTITIQGSGETIRRVPPSLQGSVQFYRLFYVSASGNLTFQDLTLKDGFVRGGNGGNNLGAGGGGGGGLGAGGAIFNMGTLTINRCLFTNNTAQGGNGGNATGGGSSKGGSGGGGLGGNGGNIIPFLNNGGAGGGGFFGNGSATGSNAGGGGGGSATSGSGQTGGSSGGGTGGNAGSIGGAGSAGGGGGGSGFGVAQDGGTGSIGGGGGGSGGNTSTTVSSRGGTGGFGGGGGGGGVDSNGGFGGFGGGGGGGSRTFFSTAIRSPGGGLGGGIGGSPGTNIGAGGGGGGGGLGGAIFNHGGTITITNSTFSGNSAIGGVGGNGTTQSMNGHIGLGSAASIFNRNGFVTALNCTFTNNTANADPAAISARAFVSLGDGSGGNAIVVLNNCIIGQSDVDIDKQEFATFNNNQGTTSGSGKGNLVRSLQAAFGFSVNSVEDPRLGPLADNGGPTFTHRPSAGSPVIDNGDNSLLSRMTTDQRRGSTVRVFNGKVDIGAVEEQPRLIARPVLSGGSLNGSGQPIHPVAGQFQLGTPIPFFPGKAVNVRTAIGDVNGDGFADFIGGTGPGSATQVKIISGAKGNTIAVIDPFESAFTGGVFVASGDFDADGKADVVVTPDQGGGPIAALYCGAKLSAGLTNDAAQFRRFFAIEDPFFRGGARPAVGDLNADGQADLVVSAGFQGGPRIAIFDGISLALVTASPSRLISDFFAFEPTLRNGAFVAVGDMNGDGFAEVFFGAGPAGGPRVRMIDGAKLLGAGSFNNLDAITKTAQLANFFAGDSTLRGGVRLAIADIDNNGIPDLITGSGDGEPSRVRVIKSPNLFGNPIPSPDQTLDPFGEILTDGVYVG